jgi:hypothetical protein
MYKAVIELWKVESQIIYATVSNQLPKFDFCIDVSYYFALKRENLERSVQSLFKKGGGHAGTSPPVVDYILYCQTIQRVALRPRGGLHDLGVDAIIVAY